MPALAAQVMGGGFSAGQVSALNGSINNAIAGAGTTRATATALTNSLVNVSSGAALSGVSLPALSTPGDEIVIFNGGSNTIVVYPQSSTAKFNGLGAGSGFNLAAGSSVQCNMITNTQWTAILSA